MSDHQMLFENESAEKLDEHGLHPNSWVERYLTGYARTTCTCGIDTGRIARDDALRAFEEHRDAVSQ